MKRRMSAKITAVITAMAMILLSFNVVFAQNIVTKAGTESLTFETVSETEVKVSICNPDASGSITIPEKYDGKTVVEIAEGAFLGCENLTEVVIPSTVKTIGDSAFEFCLSLNSIAVPDGVETIGLRAFAESGIKTASIGKNVSSIKEGAFTNCANLTAINTASDNSAFSSDNGVLFNNEKTCLINYPAGKTGEYTLPVSTTQIADTALEGAKNLTGVTLNYGLQTIGEYAFACTGIKTISIPTSVTQIGAGAFSGCESLSEILWPYSAQNVSTRVFENCISLKSAVIPTGVKTIGDMAFIECTALENVELSEGLNTIGSSAFRNCSKLETVVIPASVTLIENSAFMHASSLSKANFKGAAPESFGGNVFTGTSIDFAIGYTQENALSWAPNGETTWNGYALVKYDEADIDIPVDANFDYILINGNAVITGYKGTGGNVVIPEKIGKDYPVTGIDDFAFNVTGIESITIPDTVQTIGTEAFAYCTKLTTVKIGKGVSSIGSGIFSNSPNIKTIEVSQENSVYTVENNAIYTKDGMALIVCAPATEGTFTVKNGTKVIAASAFESCGKITKIVLPASVQTIGNYAFFACSALKEVNLENSITSIGNSAFYDCSSLESIILPIGITSIEDNTFNSCTALKSIALQGGIKTIGFAVFANCESLETITIPDSVESIGKSAFNGCGNLKSAFIGAAVNSIGDNAFRDAKALEYAVFYGETPEEFGERVFENTSENFIIYYPENYKLSWSPNGETTWNTYKIAVFESANIPTPTPPATPDVTPTPTPGTDVLEGDVNLDGKVNSRDIAAMQKHVIGGEVLAGDALTAADLTGDGKINSRDIAALQKKLLG